MGSIYLMLLLLIGATTADYATPANTLTAGGIGGEIPPPFAGHHGREQPAPGHRWPFPKPNWHWPRRRSPPPPTPLHHGGGGSETPPPPPRGRFHFPRPHVPWRPWWRRSPPPSPLHHGSASTPPPPLPVHNGGSLPPPPPRHSWLPKPKTPLPWVTRKSPPPPLICY
ncbi:PREDICTED: formin-like protein 20 [Erythranthe guttata]|uniref:formin-like protein 20 n=1 Tax=Erythranthe guttata TaxID=4155 RepID=UPI00064DA319|nr:PREDICTED: formin-like protein 20 [Erythranthe guttata]|eukprot:XP_012828572.1 PREDICTED: formin-like protein 20 [Erythranthe guttata]